MRASFSIKLISIHTTWLAPTLAWRCAFSLQCSRWSHWKRGKKKQSQTALLCISSCALQTANTRQLQEHWKNKIKDENFYHWFSSIFPPQKMGSGHLPLLCAARNGSSTLWAGFQKNIFWVLQVPPSSPRAKKPQCLNKKPADVNSKLELHLHSDRKSLLKQPPAGKDIHIHPFNAVSYPSPSRWILVSLHRRRTIPIVQLLLEEKC